MNLCDASVDLSDMIDQNPDPFHGRYVSVSVVRGEELELRI